jgi:hypothetical protein
LILAATRVEAAPHRDTSDGLDDNDNDNVDHTAARSRSAGRPDRDDAGDTDLGCGHTEADGDDPDDDTRRDRNADLDDAFGYLRGFEARDPDAIAEMLEAGDDTSFDHPSVRDVIETGASFESTAFADASELENLELRHHRPSRWGRLDLNLGWRRVWKPRELIIPLGPAAPGPHGPIAPRHHDDTVWLRATWRR